MEPDSLICGWRIKNTIHRISSHYTGNRSQLWEQKDKKQSETRNQKKMIVVLKIVKKVVGIFKRRRVLGYSTAYILFLWLFSSFAFHKIENTPLFDSFYWIVTTTTTVGYGDITPTTEAGKLLSMFVMISGIGVLGVLLATIAEVMIEKSLKRRPTVLMENHIITLGWNGIVETAVKELLKENMEVVVVADVDDIPVDNKNLTFIKGDITEEEILKTARIEKSVCVIISGKNENETLLSAISVKKLNEKVRVACVVSDPKVKRALDMLGVDQTISIQEFSGLFLGRFVFAPRVSSVFRELMSSEGVDLFENPVSGVEGKTFREIVDMMKDRHDALVIGVVRDGSIMLNPEKELKLKRGDEVIYISKRRLTGI